MTAVRVVRGRLANVTSKAPMDSERPNYPLLVASAVLIVTGVLSLVMLLFGPNLMF